MIAVAAAAVVLVGIVGFVLAGPGGGGRGSSMRTGGDAILSDRGMTMPMIEGPGADIDERWSIRLGGNETWGGAADRDRVFYIAGDDRGRFDLVALSRDDGEEIWSAPVPEQPTVVSVDDSVVLAVSLEEVVAFEAASGDELWSIRVDGYAEVGLTGSGDLALAAPGEFLYVDLSSGEELWSTRGDSFYVADSALYVLDRGRLSKLEADGDERWQVDVVGEATDLAAASGVVVVSDGFDVTAYDAGSGEELWDDRLNGDEVYVQATRDELLVTEVDFDVSGLDLRALSADGEELWSERDRSIHDVIIRGGEDLLSVSSDFEDICIVIAESGDERGCARANSSPFVRTTSALLIGDDGDVRAYSLDDVEERWSLRTSRDSTLHAVPGGIVEFDWDREELVFYE